MAFLFQLIEDGCQGKPIRNYEVFFWGGGCFHRPAGI